MSNVAKVLDVLENHLPAIEDKFCCINLGGCGLMAQIIAEQLDLLNVNYNVICNHWGAEGKFTNCEVNQLIDEKNKYDMPNGHILIEVDGRYFDSEGEKTPGGLEITAIIDHETIVRMNEGDYWNKTFNRGQVDGMREFTGKVFKKAFGESAFSKLTSKLGL